MKGEKNAASIPKDCCMDNHLPLVAAGAITLTTELTNEPMEQEAPPRKEAKTRMPKLLKRINKKVETQNKIMLIDTATPFLHKSPILPKVMFNRADPRNVKEANTLT